MARLTDLPRSGFQCGTASDSATGDTVNVFVDFVKGGLCYRLNGGPIAPVPDWDRIPAETSLGHIAMGLLLDHQRACEASDAEELTLP